MVVIAESEESKRIRGIILAESATIDNLLSEFLADHFSEDKEKKKELLENIFNKDYFGFYRKIDLIKKIVDKEFWSERDELIEALTWIRKKRNLLAHGVWVIEKSQSGISVLKETSKNRTLKMDKSLLEEFNKKVFVIFKFIDAWFADSRTT